jgi:hypothetical protein
MDLLLFSERNHGVASVTCAIIEKESKVFLARQAGGDPVALAAPWGTFVK